MSEIEFKVDWGNIRTVMKKYARNYYEVKNIHGVVLGTAKQQNKLVNIAPEISKEHGLITVFHNGKKYQRYENGRFIGWLNGCRDELRPWLNLE